MHMQMSARPRSASAFPRSFPRPLVVDVDGTLIRTDLLYEAALYFAMRHPFQLWRLPGWLAQGPNILKRRLAERIALDLLVMPLNEDIVALIRDAQSAGRPIYLASAADRSQVEALAVRLGGVAGIFASDETANVAGAVKAARLIEAFGAGSFDYVGNSKADLPVWQAAGGAIAVSPGAVVQRQLRTFHADARVIDAPRARPIDYLRSLRPHHCAKNLLLLVPVVTIHHFDAASILRAVAAMLAFCCAASSAYLLNDLADLTADRRHPRKRHRPFAAGLVPITHGILMASLLLVVTGLVASLLPPPFLIVVGTYVVATLAYSFSLKRQLLIDVMTLSGLYTLRVFAGAAAIGTDVSPWLLMFCMFIFLSLPIVKRCSELALHRDRGEAAIAGRGYQVGDFPVMIALGAAAACGAVLVFALYVSSSDVMLLYRHPHRLWAGCPLLLAWLSRLLLLSHRGEIHDDPLVFALTDRGSLATGLLFGGVIALAI